MSEGNTSIINIDCTNPNDAKGLHVWFHIFLSVLYFLIFLVSILFSYLKFKQNKFKSFTEALKQILIPFTLLIKVIFLSIESYFYQTGKPFKNLSVKLFVILFPGYLISSTYFVIIYSWCTVFGEFIGGVIQKIFKVVKYVILFLIFAFLGFFVLFLSFGSKWREAEAILAICRDSIIALMYLIMFILIRVKLDLHCKIGYGGSSEEIIFTLCIIMACALFIRILVRVCFSFIKLTECNVRYFYSWIMKELFGQLLLLTFVVFSDICNEKKKIDITTDPLIGKFSIDN